MRPEWQRVLIYLLILGFFGLNAWYWWKKRRLRRSLAAEGKLVEDNRQIKSSLRTAAWAGPLLVGVVAMMFYLEPRLGKRSTFFIVAGTVFGGFLVVGLVRQALTRDAAVARADALARAGKVEEALAELRSAMAQRPDGRRAQAVAMILFNAERLDEAVEALRVARELKPDDVSNEVMETLALLKLKRFEEARGIVESARQRWLNESGLAYLHALVMAELGKLVEASEQYRQGMELAQAAADDQHIDLMTQKQLHALARDRLEELGASTQYDRAFVVQPARGPDGPRG